MCRRTTAPIRRQPEYTLTAVMVHTTKEEQPTSGHYVAFVRGNNGNDKWYRVNDAYVYDATEDEVRSWACAGRVRRGHASMHGGPSLCRAWCVACCCQAAASTVCMDFCLGV